MRSRSATLASLFFLLTACSSGTFVDGTATGAASFDFRASTLEPASGSLPANAARDITPLLLMLGGLDQESSLSCKTCPQPKPTLVELVLDAPPPLVYAGPWKAPQATLSLQAPGEFGEAQDVRAWDFARSQASFTLTFDEPSFSGSGKTVMTARGTVSAESAPPEPLRLSGKFGLEYRCHLQEKYFRFCGNTRGADGASNPVHRPYTENTCPAELVQPYEASPVWKGNTLTLGELKVDCRETEGTPSSDGARPLLCYQKRDAVKANGCTWRVHFLTDGTLQQFAVAAWADEQCPRKTCNTYR